MNRKYWLLSASILMIFVGILRVFGGIALWVKGRQLDTGIPIIASETQIYFIAVGLLVIGVLLVFTAIRLVRDYSKKNWNICWLVLLIFVVDGLLNGFILFGQPVDRGQQINLAVVTVIGLSLLSGKPALKIKNKNEL